MFSNKAKDPKQNSEVRIPWQQSQLTLQAHSYMPGMEWCSCGELRNVSSDLVRCRKHIIENAAIRGPQYHNVIANVTSQFKGLFTELGSGRFTRNTEMCPAVTVPVNAQSNNSSINRGLTEFESGSSGSQMDPQNPFFVLHSNRKFF